MDMYTRKRTREGEIIRRVKAVVEYNFKGRVDRYDQLLTYHGLHRHTVKWYQKFFFQMLNMSCVNSDILYKKAQEQLPIDQQRTLDHTAFLPEPIKDQLHIANTTDGNPCPCPGRRPLEQLDPIVTSLASSHHLIGVMHAVKHAVVLV